MWLACPPIGVGPHGTGARGTGPERELGLAVPGRSTAPRLSVCCCLTGAPVGPHLKSVISTTREIAEERVRCEIEGRTVLQGGLRSSVERAFDTASNRKMVA